MLGSAELHVEYRRKLGNQNHPPLKLMALSARSGEEAREGSVLK